MRASFGTLAISVAQLVDPPKLPENDPFSKRANLYLMSARVRACVRVCVRAWAHFGDAPCLYNILKGHFDQAILSGENIPLPEAHQKMS